MFPVSPLPEKQALVQIKGYGCAFIQFANEPLTVRRANHHCGYVDEPDVADHLNGLPSGVVNNDRDGPRLFRPADLVLEFTSTPNNECDPVLNVPLVNKSLRRRRGYCRSFRLPRCLFHHRQVSARR